MTKLQSQTKSSSGKLYFDERLDDAIRQLEFFVDSNVSEGAIEQAKDKELKHKNPEVENTAFAGKNDHEIAQMFSKAKFTSGVLANYQVDVGGGKTKRRFVLEHNPPVGQVKSELLALDNSDVDRITVKRIIGKMDIIVMTRHEDNRLKDAGYRDYRPKNAFQDESVKINLFPLFD